MASSTLQRQESWYWPGSTPQGIESYLFLVISFPLSLPEMMQHPDTFGLPCAWVPRLRMVGLALDVNVHA